MCVSCRVQPEARFPNALDVSESIPVSITDMTEDSSAAGPDDAQLARWALLDWSRALDGRLRFHIVEAEEDALVRVRFVPPSGGQYLFANDLGGGGIIGEMFSISVDGRRGAVVFVRPDTQALGPVIAGRATRDPLFRETVVYLTCLHELGHALGLGHTAEYADIMYALGDGGDIEEYFMRYRRNLSDRSDIEGETGLSRSDRAHIRALYSRIRQGS